MNGKRVKPSGAKTAVPGRGRKALILLGVAAFLATSFVMGIVVARYVQARDASGTVVAKEFYFTSDVLTETGEEYTLNAGTTALTLQLRNHVDMLRYAEEDISYAVYVEKDGTYYQKDADGNLVAAGSEAVVFDSGTLEKNQKSNASITLKGLVPGKYEITAAGEAGKGGYKEDLYATFTVDPDEAGVYKYVDARSDYYVLLTVWTENVAGEASIGISGNGLIPDNTDPAMAGAETGATVTDDDSFAAPYSSHTYRFFRETVGDGGYTANDFTVTVNGTGATEKDPEQKLN